MDDIAVTCRGYDEKQTTRGFIDDLAGVKQWIRNNNMVLNDEMEQTFVSAEKMLKPCEELRQDSKGEV